MCGLSVRASDTAVGIPRAHQVRSVGVGGSALTSPRPRDAAVTPRLVRPRPGAMTGLRLALAPTPLTLRGAVSHYLSLEKELAHSSS